MDFKTINKQRKFILIASAVGIIGMFLPWVDVFFVNVNGMHGKGIIVFLCFVASLVISLLGDKTLALDKTMWMVTLITAVLSVLLMGITFFQVRNAFVNVLSYGFYITLLASIGVLVAAYFFRSPGDNLQNGFDSLKKDIESKTKSNNPS